MPEKKSDSAKNQLVIPPGAADDPKAFELVRAWVAQGDLHVSLQMGGWDDPTAWGVVLADLVRHVARFYEEQKHLRPEQTIARVRDAMDAELDGEDGGVAGWRPGAMKERRFAPDRLTNCRPFTSPSASVQDDTFIGKSTPASGGC